MEVFISTLGFDERPVIRTLLSIGIENLGKLVILVPNWEMDERTVSAINEIKKITGIAGLEEIVVEKINVDDFWAGVGQITNILYQAYIGGAEKIHVNISGGLRILVIQTYTATLLTNRELQDRTTIYIMLETTKEIKKIKLSEIPICIEVGLDEKNILMEIIKNESQTLTTLSRKLSIPKTTLWKKLKKLETNKLITKTRKGYTLTPKAKNLLKSQIHNKPTQL